MDKWLARAFVFVLLMAGLALLLLSLGMLVMIYREYTAV